MSRGTWQSLFISSLIVLVPLVFFSSENELKWVTKHKTLSDVLVTLPYFLFLITAFLSSKMNQWSTVFCCLLFGVVYFVLTNPLEGVSEPSKARAVAIGIPISLSLLFFIQPGRLLSEKGLLLVSATVLPVGVLLTLLVHEIPHTETFLVWQKLSAFQSWALPDLSLLLVQVFALSVLWQRDVELKHFSLVTLVSLLPLFFALNAMARGDFPRLEGLMKGVCFSTISLVLVYSIYRMYWQKIYIDELTEIPNRRALEAAMLKLGRFYTMAMVDVDHFKKFNDTYGHQEGDNVLRFVAFHLARQSGMRAYRYGGEEFCLLYSGKIADDVYPRVDDIRRSLAEREFYIRSPQEVRDRTSKKDRGKRAVEAQRVKVTVSIGVASPSDTAVQPEEVLKAADKMLYEAKAKGRNQVVLWLGEDSLSDVVSEKVEGV